MFAGLASSIRGARPWAIAVLASVGLLAASDARAQWDEGPPARALTGVLKRIKETGGVRLGYREGAVPFSYTGRDGKPYGYSIDLCQAIVQDIAEAVGVASLRVEYRRVTVIDRIDQVVDGALLLGRRVEPGGDVADGNDQEMTRGDRIFVIKSHSQVVAQHDGAG